MKNSKPNGPIFSTEFKEVVKRLEKKDSLIDEVVSRDEDRPEECMKKGAQTNGQTEKPKI
ncbi:MAG: hypothetical protein ACLQPD_36025 [Desulfomonilaceae bacterium]